MRRTLLKHACLAALLFACLLGAQALRAMPPEEQPVPPHTTDEQAVPPYTQPEDPLAGALLACGRGRTAGRPALSARWMMHRGAPPLVPG